MKIALFIAAVFGWLAFNVYFWLAKALAFLIHYRVSMAIPGERRIFVPETRLAQNILAWAGDALFLALILLLAFA